MKNLQPIFYHPTSPLHSGKPEVFENRLKFAPSSFVPLSKAFYLHSHGMLFEYAH